MTPEHTALVERLDAVTGFLHKDGAHEAAAAIRELQERFNNSAQLAAERFAETIKLSAELRALAGEVERLRQTIELVRCYPDFDDPNNVMSKAMDSALAGESVAILAKIDQWQHGESANSVDTLVAERDTLRAERDDLAARIDHCSEGSVLCWEAERDTLRAEVAALRKALKSSPCPCPIDDDCTVDDCIKNGHCGCDNSTALADKQGET